MEITYNAARRPTIKNAGAKAKVGVNVLVALYPDNPTPIVVYGVGASLRLEKKRRVVQISSSLRDRRADDPGKGRLSCRGIGHSTGPSAGVEPDSRRARE